MSKYFISAALGSDRDFSRAGAGEVSIMASHGVKNVINFNFYCWPLSIDGSKGVPLRPSPE